MDNHRYPNRPSPKHLRIPGLKKLLEGRAPQDFERLRHPLADRTIQPKDLGMSVAAQRPDLLQVVDQTGGGPRLKMTARKLRSGKIR